MATAHVTGAVALYLAQHPAASLFEVRAVLLDNAREFVVGVNGSTTNKSVWVGGATGGNNDSNNNSNIFETRISSTNDDAEEEVDDGDMSLSSSDLELISDGSKAQLVGIRFTGLNIPKGATITRAYIQFTVDEKNSGTTNLTFRGQDSDDAAAFSSSDYNISSRPTTSASANWNPSAWNSVGEAGANQRTPDLSNIVQEIVNRGAWNSGNDMAFIVTGSGERTAESYNGDDDKAPLLHVEWQ